MIDNFSHILLVDYSSINHDEMKIRGTIMNYLRKKEVSKFSLL